MNILENDHQHAPDQASSVNLYCMAAMVADEASRTGYRNFSRELEAALSNFLTTLPRDEQGTALRLSYEMALGGEDAAPPRLRLVYSRA